jgi:hypothetical protein
MLCHKEYLCVDLLALSCSLWLLAGGVPAGATEIDDLPRSKNKFGYFELGVHVPPQSGYPLYGGRRVVISRDLGLPLAISPKNNEHMYCNTQVWGYKADGTPGGKSNHPQNYTFPWTSTFCEVRWTDLQPTRACRVDSPPAHQGTDCRPPEPKADHYWIVAVEEGTVVTARPNLVEIVGSTSTIRWKYRHGGSPVVTRSQKVKKGDRLAQVTDLGSTPIHLHLESEIPAGTDVDNLPALIVAYQKALGNKVDVVDGKLAFDSQFEIPASGIGSACAAAENAEGIGTEKTFSFSSLWCHNGSIMGLVSEGEHMKLVYYKPASLGLAASVRDDPVLVEGGIQSGRFKGIARHYNKQCGNQTFEVSGPVTGATPQALIVEGIRVQFVENCERRSTRENLAFGFMRSFVPPVGDDRRTLTELTRNWGAITMSVANREEWLPYVRTWPGLLPTGERADSNGGMLPAFQTDEAGVGIWWYWITVRKGFGETGRPTLRKLALGIAGESAAPPAIETYLKNYIGIAPNYFQRQLGPDEAIDLANKNERWALAWTMFHHESGRAPLIDRTAFERGVKFGSDVINNRFQTVEYYSKDGAAIGLEADDIMERLKTLEAENATLRQSIVDLNRRIDRVRAALE